MSGGWQRGMVGLAKPRRTKGPLDRPDLNYRATPRLYLIIRAPRDPAHPPRAPARMASTSTCHRFTWARDFAKASAVARTGWPAASPSHTRRRCGSAPLSPPGRGAGGEGRAPPPTGSGSRLKRRCRATDWPSTPAPPPHSTLAQAVPAMSCGAGPSAWAKPSGPGPRLSGYQRFLVLDHSIFDVVRECLRNQARGRKLGR